MLKQKKQLNKSLLFFGIFFISFVNSHSSFAENEKLSCLCGETPSLSTAMQISKAVFL